MSTKSDPASGFHAITPSDSAGLGYFTRGVYVGGAGVIKCISADGNTASFTAPAGALLPIVTNFVYDTDTTATLLVALY